MISLKKSSANASFLLAQMESEAIVLKERKENIEKCLLEMEEQELQMDKDDARKAREKYYEETREEITTKYETCYNALLDTMSEFATVPDQNATMAPPQ